MSRTFTTDWRDNVSLTKFVFLGLSLLLTVSACTFWRPEVSGRSAEVIKVSPSQNLQSAIDRARPGDVIELEAGKVYEGPIKLPAKSGDAFITIQSSAVAQLPEGKRVGPAQRDLFAKLQTSTAGEPVIKTTAGSHHYRLVGLEISTAKADMKAYDLVS